jgi:hypothetical protein
MKSAAQLEQEWLDRIEPEWLEFYRMTPEQRWTLAAELRRYYLAMGGSLDPDADPQSPFWSEDEITGFARTATPQYVKLRRRDL